MTIRRVLVALWMLQTTECLMTVSRRDIATSFLSLPFLMTTTITRYNVDESAAKDPPDYADDGITHGFQYSTEWTGTRLPLVDLETASLTASTSSSWNMARWPDAVLRRPASPVDERWLGTETLQRAAKMLIRTARKHRAVGLAAQQCGVDASMVYLELPRSLSFSQNPEDGVVWINPVIVRRSPETEMKVWTEFCLVLPPNFRATVVRDAWVDVEYHSVDGGARHVTRLHGELARAAQHELDHDRGILTLDHIDLEEMENDAMRTIERDGHEDRQRLAFSR
ncbi:Removes the formyl group from the N-terminal Met of newly synthesized protein [Fragilaria crotonensis]|nr:Removes the formyl group from the N-terminal Met of newly synthesized protein [Fragilaria crotonensis]